MAADWLSDLLSPVNGYENRLGEYLFLPCLANPPTSKSGDLESK
jgi:hypothetical protein